MAHDLDLIIDRAAVGLLSHQVGRQLIDLIVAGVLHPGEKLPSSRHLAGHLGVSRTTIVEAYDWLCDLGYAESRPRSSTVVRPLRLPAAAGRTLRPTAPSAPAEPTIDFRPGLPDLAAFPHRRWGLTLARAARRVAPAALGYGDPLGDARLRQVLSAYLRRGRGLEADPANIVITAGTGQAVDILLRALPRPSEIVTEAPGPEAHARLARTYRTPVRPVPVDAEGLCTERLPQAPARRLAYVIPSHQFPLGGVMSMERRLALLAWAEATDACIVEDDYDSEFAYDGRPSVPLAKLDASGRVVYAGTFSKTLVPALRIGFMIVPDALLERVRALKWWADHGGSPLQQQALAEWIETGRFERHVHRMRRIYCRRFELLTGELAHRLGARVRIAGSRVGMHVAAFVTTRESAAALAARAAGDGLTLYPIDMPPDAPAGEAGFVFGFGNLGETEISEGVARFARLIGQAA